MKSKKARWAIVSIVAIIWIVLLLINLFNPSPADFWKASASTLLNTIIVLAVSYWLVQDRIDGRKNDDVVTSILNRAEDAFAELLERVNTMLVAFEGSNQSDAMIERQIMLSCKQKVDNHIDLLEQMRHTEKYLSDHKQLRRAIKKFNECVEEIPVATNQRITSTQKNKILRNSNLVSSKFATLYVTIHMH